MNTIKIIKLIRIPVDVISEDEVLDDMICDKENYKHDPELYQWLCNSGCYSERTDHINNVISSETKADFVADVIDNYQNGPDMLDDTLAYYGVEQYKEQIISIMEEGLLNEI